MKQFSQDLRYALRMMAKSPGLTLVVVLSLAIGIGANSAVFSVVDALLLRPLPYPEPDRLVNIWLRSPGIGILRDWPSPGQFDDLRKESHSFEEISIAQLRDVTLTGRDQPERLAVVNTTSNLLRLLGAKPMLGRLLIAEDDAPGKTPVVVLTHRVWQRLFNSDRQIVGKSVTLSGKQATVAGVLSADFQLSSEVMPAEGPMDKVDAFLPLPLDEKFLARRGDENYNLLARLKPGIAVSQAQADVDLIAGRIRDKDKRDRTFGMSVTCLQEQVVGDVRRAVLVLLGSVGLVLLIACANVANLLMTRASAREKEFAIRTALGAGGYRIVRQLLTESIVLSLLGGLGGLLIARWTLAVVRTMNPGNIPRLDDIAIDGTVLAFTLVVSLGTGILFGLAPAWRIGRLDLHTPLKSGGRSGESDGGFQFARNRTRGVLVIAEVALSLMLLVGAGLLIRSFVRLQSVNPGFSTANLLSMQVAASGPKYRDDKVAARFQQEVAGRISHVAGVRSQGIVSPLPLTGGVGWGQINVEGYTPPPGQELQVDLRLASADYFRTMQIPLLQGRFFNEHDTIDSPQVAIIDAEFAKRFWPRETAVGKRLWFDPKKPILIAGVAGTVKQYGLDADSKIAVYFPVLQTGASGGYLVVRSASDPAGLSRDITQAIRSVEPDALVYDIQTMDQRLSASLARQRFSTSMLGAFAGFALLLAAVGIYGVMSHLVTQGTRDLGVRMALGAQAGDVLQLVLRHGMGLVICGIGGGLIGAFLLSRVMAILLFGVTATDAVTFGTVVLLLGLVAVAAILIPALRALRVDPIVALRDE